MSIKTIAVPYADGSEYVFMPACCYNGNRFDVLKKDYPPMFTPQEARLVMPVTITDVPRLNKDGSGRIEVTTGDVATPCVGVFHPGRKKATFVFTVQQADGENIGLCYEQGVITLSAPAKRRQLYRWPHMVEQSAPCRVLEVEIPAWVFHIECESMEAFYRFYFEHRTCAALDMARPEAIPFRTLFKIQREKFNRMNWHEREGFYDVDAKGQWQPGWVGGAMSGYALMKLGGDTEKQRAVRTLSYLFDNQAPSGLFYGLANRICDGFGTPGAEKWLLVRKSADALYFLYKHFECMEEVPARFIEGARRAADCFADMWERFGQFGQFADCDTGRITVGGSTCGAIVPAALAASYRYFGTERYLKAAEQSAESMYRRDALNGYTTGGPGEILQCPDSESAFALLESMTVLYEVTGYKRWLSHAMHCAHLCASWVVSYNYRFPSQSEFGRLGMKTIGCVFANIQNKHAAPGICTLSGNSLSKLWQWTGDPLYRELYLQIALSIGQYMSTKERPIHSWSVPGDALVNGVQGQFEHSEALPEGFICERVNMSDWETQACVGGVFYGSCWCETSLLLTMAEWPEALERP